MDAFDRHLRGVCGSECPWYAFDASCGEEPADCIEALEAKLFSVGKTNPMVRSTQPVFVVLVDFSVDFTIGLTVSATADICLGTDPRAMVGLYATVSVDLVAAATGTLGLTSFA